MQLAAFDIWTREKTNQAWLHGQREEAEQAAFITQDNMS